MKSKLLKRIFGVALATILSVSSMVVSMPVSVYAEEGPQEPSVTTYATPDQLKDANNFELGLDYTNNSGVPQKVNFGNGIIWYIAGADADADGSLVLICDPYAKYFGKAKFLDENNYREETEEVYINNSKFDGKEVYANHYGASDIRKYLTGSDEVDGEGDYALEKFTAAEQELMKTTTVITVDNKSGDKYQTSDKLYLACVNCVDSPVMFVGSGEDNIWIWVHESDTISPYTNGGDNFWLRSPGEQSIYAMQDGNTGLSISSVSVKNSRAVVPVFNLDLSSVLFASSATAASSEASLGDTMTFRIDAGSLIISTAKYNKYGINVTKGNDSGALFLYVQGKDDNGDWVKTFEVPAEGLTVFANDIREGADLSKCKIWLETTNGNDNLAYAKMVTDEDTTEYNLSLNVNDEKMGNATASVNGNQVTSALFCAPVVLTATPNDGYDFIKWESEDVTVDEECRFTMPAKDVSLTAVFAPHDFGEDGTADECSVCKIKNINAASLDDKVVINDLLYTEQEQSPTVTIEGLTENTDYEISYDSPKTDVGEYDVMIKGIGQCFGIRNAKWKIVEASPICTAPTGLTATFGQKLRNVSLEEINPSGNTEGSWSWNKELQSVGNAGDNTFKATFTPADTHNYKVMDDIDVTVTVEKAEYTDDESYTEAYFWNKQSDEEQIDLTQFVPEDAGDTSFEITSQSVFPEGATDTISSAHIENGVLKFAVSSMENHVLNAATTIEVKVTTQNYEEYTKTIRIARTAEGLWCAAIPDRVFTGKAVKPTLEVYSDGKLLTLGKDYTVTYKNNTKVADKEAVNTKGASIAPTAVITGKGNYSGKVTLTFSIVKRNLSGSEAAVAADGYNGADYEAAMATDMLVASTGKDISVSTTVTVDGKKLKAGTDYYIAKDAQGSEPVVKILKDDTDYAGTHKLYVVGKGNYTGAVAFDYVVTADKLASKVTIGKIANQPYNNGEEVEPAVVIKDGKTDVTDKFDVTYENNTEIGTATVTVTAKEDSGYTGSKNATFKIVGTSIAKAKLGANGKGKIETFIYSGSPCEPTLDLYLGNTQLSSETDYTLSYTKNVNAGTATVTVTGKGAYTGTRKFTYKINKYDATKDEANLITVKNVNGSDKITADYEKGAVTPKVSVRMNGQLLVEKQDYTLSYSNNKAVATENAVNAKGKSIAPTITVTFKGNFSGKKTKTFKIAKKDIGECTLTVADKGYSTKKNAWKQTTITITDVNGKKLAAKTDYDKTVKYYSDPGCETEITDGVVAPATTVYVKAVGCNNYTGEVVGKYFISNKNISSAKVTIASNEYTGKAVKPVASDIVVTIGSGKNMVTLIAGTDYEIVDNSYKNNVNKGAATVTIRGIGDYYGTKTVKFSITAKITKWWKDLLSLF